MVIERAIIGERNGAAPAAAAGARLRGALSLALPLTTGLLLLSRP